MPIDFKPTTANSIDFRPAAPAVGPGFLQRADDAVAKIANTGYDVAKGAGKGVISTLFGAGQLLQKGANKVRGVFGFSPKPLEEKPDVLTPKNTAQKAGFTLEQLAEFLVPAGEVGRAGKAVEATIDASKTASKLPSFLRGAAKVAGSSVTEGLATGATRAAQTGDAGDGVKAGLFAGGLSGVFNAAGKSLRATGMSEKLYSQIFKNANDDMTAALKTGALKNLKETNPARFEELVKSEIIKAGANGEVAFDPTLAREALDRGLKGSIKNMSNVVVKKTLDLEEAARGLADRHANLVEIPNWKKYANLLNQIRGQYKGTFLEGRGKDAAEFVNLLSKREGRLTGDKVLALRRFLDKMRVASSYRPNTHLSIAQEDFRAATDKLRGVLSDSIPGMGKVMNEYRFYLQALESLGKEAAKRGNSAVINLIDTALFGFGGGLAGPSGAAALPLTRRALTLPSVLTGIGSKIEKGNKGNFGRVLRGAASQAITPQK